jgi:hypothetical protein
VRCGCFICELKGLTDRLNDYRLWRTLEMGRLDDKFAKAGGVVQRVEQKIETRLDAIIAREDQIAQKTDRVFDRHAMPIDEADKALDALDRKLDLLSNGGPQGPLPGSGDSQEPVQSAPMPDGRTFQRIG